MIKELSTFVQTLDPDLKALGMKPKEGLHLMLRIQTDEDNTIFIDENSLRGWGYTKTKNPAPDETALIDYCATLAQVAWCVNTNKCFDLPTKAIHSCSPYCVAIKRENLVGGEKYQKNAQSKKTQVYERINDYFAKTFDLIEETEKQRVEVFKYSLNSEEKFQGWLDQIPAFADMKDAEYVIFYLDEPIEKYQQANTNYLADKLFNTSEYNKEVGEVTFGTSDFKNGFPTKKPFLMHQSAAFEIAGRISAKEARYLHEFQDIMGRGILPRPLPIFIHQEELKVEGKRSLRDASIALFKAEAEAGRNIGYKEIIEALYRDYEDQFGNYYLLFYQRGEIRDFDFVSKFEYEMKDENGKPWEIKDYFQIKYQRKIENVFDFQYAVLLPVFNNALVVKTKVGGFQYKYFDDIDAKYCKSDNTYLLVMTYRKAFYDFIYKSKREAVSQETFDRILLTSTLDDIKLDEIKNGYHSQNVSIRQKLNIWFSLSEKFNNNQKPTSETMASRLQEHRAFIKQLAKGETSIQTDDEYAFTVGQVIYYLFSKSKTADRSYKRLEPFMQQVRAEELNKAISRLFDTYKHENFSANFRNPFAEVMDYQTSKNIRDLMPTILAGVFSQNALFSDKEGEEVAEILESTEE